MFRNKRVNGVRFSPIEEYYLNQKRAQTLREAVDLCQAMLNMPVMDRELEPPTKPKEEWDGMHVVQMFRARCSMVLPEDEADIIARYNKLRTVLKQ